MATFTEELMQDANLVEAINRVKAVMESHAEDDELAETLNTITRALAGKQNNLTFDSAPTSGSSNPVTSDGVKTALDGKQNNLTFDSTPTSGSSNPVTSNGIRAALLALENTVQDALIFDTEPTAGSTNPVTSNGIKAALDAEASRAATAEASKVSKPETNQNGTQGQMLQSDGAGGTVWADVGTPTDAQASSAIAAWLNQHPEATTTVQDGSITKTKLNDDIFTDVINPLNNAGISNNLVGLEADVFYKIDPPIKVGESFTVGVPDGAPMNRFCDYYWFDKDKNQINNGKRLYTSSTVQTTVVSGSDVHYFKWGQKPAKFLKVERGSQNTPYTPYFRPYSERASNLRYGNDYYKQRLSYPDSFTEHYAVGSTGQCGSVNANYNTMGPVLLNAGDVLHYRLCSANNEGIIALYDLTGTFIENAVVGQGGSIMLEGSVTLTQDCYVIVSHRWFNVTNQETYFYVNDSIFRRASESMTADEVRERAFVSGYGSLTGWDTHAAAFSKLMADVTDTEGFLFFTDSHFMSKRGSNWEEYAQEIFSYLEKLYYASPCSFVLHGGDWLGTGEARLDMLPKLSAINGIFRSRFDRYALLVGNHECGNQSEEHQTFTHDTLASTLLANVGKTYYMFSANTFHMYCFDTWASGSIDTYADEQIEWFASSLENETETHIVIAMHILYDSTNLSGIGNQVTMCAKAYNERALYTYNNKVYDFTNATGKVAFVIAGHNHADATGTVNDIPYILSVNTTGYSETTFANLPLPVDLMKIDWSNGKLTAYRATRGLEGSIRELSVIV